MPYDLHSDAERARETMWARQQDAKAVEALRKKLDAEKEMAQNVSILKERPKG